METQTQDLIKKIINQHEESIRHYMAGNEAEKIAAILNHYEHLSAGATAKRKQVVEDVLVYFRSVVMLCESIGIASTHAEKAARLRGLIELLNSAITKLKSEHLDNILSNWQGWNWDYADLPYRKVLEKGDQYRKENERLKAFIKEKNIDTTEIDNLPF